MNKSITNFGEDGSSLVLVEFGFEDQVELKCHVYQTVEGHPKYHQFFEFCCLRRQSCVTKHELMSKDCDHLYFIRDMIDIDCLQLILSDLTWISTILVKEQCPGNKNQTYITFNNLFQHEQDILDNNNKSTTTSSFSQNDLGLATHLT